MEVIVHTWKRNIIRWWLLLPQGVSGAIKRRAGYAPFRELARRRPAPLGGAVETGAGQLPFKAIIHLAGINMFWRSSEWAIRGCARSALGLARERGYRSIAFPLIGAGTGGVRLRRCWRSCRTKLDGTTTVARFGLSGLSRRVEAQQRCGSPAGIWQQPADDPGPARK